VNEICLKKLLLTSEPVLVVLSMKLADLVIKRDLSTLKMPQLEVTLAVGS